MLKVGDLSCVCIMNVLNQAKFGEVKTINYCMGMFIINDFYKERFKDLMII